LQDVFCVGSAAQHPVSDAKQPAAGADKRCDTIIVSVVLHRTIVLP
jgi:hypothetical protein